MDENFLLAAVGDGAHQGLEMAQMAVDAPVRHEPQEMHPAAGSQGGGHEFAQDRIGGE